MLLRMSLHCLFGVTSAMNNVRPRNVGMVRRLFVKSGLVMFGGLPVVAGRVCKML